MCIKKLRAWSYDIRFQSLNKCIKAYDVGYDMDKKKLHSETQGVRYEEKCNVV